MLPAIRLDMRASRPPRPPPPTLIRLARGDDFTPSVNESSRSSSSSKMAVSSLYAVRDAASCSW